MNISDSDAKALMGGKYAEQIIGMIVRKGVTTRDVIEQSLLAIHPKAVELFAYSVHGKLRKSSEFCFYQGVSADDEQSARKAIEASWLLHHDRWEDAMEVLAGVDIDLTRAHWLILADFV